MKHYFDHQQESLFLDFLNQWKCSLSPEQLGLLYSFSEEVIAYNQITNLVSENDSKKLLTRHIADSLIPYLYLNQEGISLEGEWADMGSGAGFPVIPLSIVMPQIQFYAVEPRKKRCVFLRMIQEKLSLTNLEIVENTFEKSDFYDLQFTSCRALGSLEDDYKRAIPSLIQTGSFITLKSWNSLEPLRTLHSPLLQQSKQMEYQLPEETQQYVLVHLRKNG